MRRFCSSIADRVNRDLPSFPVNFPVMSVKRLCGNNVRISLGFPGYNNAISVLTLLSLVCRGLFIALLAPCHLLAPVRFINPQNLLIFKSQTLDFLQV